MRLDDSLPMHGLIVERDDAVRRFLEVALTESGYTVRCEPSGILGFAAVSTSDAPIDLLVVEEDVGEMKGTGLAAMVRLFHPKSRIILLANAYGTPAPRRGVDAVLVKPFTATALRNTLVSTPKTRAA